MGRVFNLDDIDDTADLRDVLRSGDRLRVPMMLMDAAAPTDQRRAQIEALKVSTFAAGRRLGIPAFADTKGKTMTQQTRDAMHRPGFRTAQRDAAALDARAAAYAEYEERVTTAWRDGPDSPHGAGEHGNSGAREGDRCTCKGPNDIGEIGDDGTMRRVNGELVCVSNSNPSNDAISAKDHQTRMARLYQLLDQEKSQEWRRG